MAQGHKGAKLSYKQVRILKNNVTPLNLGLAAQAVGYALADYMKLKDRAEWQVSIETLMADTNTSKNTVRKALKELTLKGVITSRPGKRWTDSEGKKRSEATHYTWLLWQHVSSEQWHTAPLNEVAAGTVEFGEKAQNIDLHRGSQIDPVKESEREPIENESSKEWLILATLVEAALESNPSPIVITLAKAMTEDREQVAKQLESIAAKSQWDTGSYLATIWKKTPELFLPRVEPRKSPYVGSPREWVSDLHNTGEHFECRPGEFGHPEGEPIQLDLLPEGVSPWAAYPWVGRG
jgi:hypothetical protein